jgi:hypothetical protein
MKAGQQFDLNGIIHTQQEMSPLSEAFESASCLLSAFSVSSETVAGAFDIPEAG